MKKLPNGTEVLIFSEKDFDIDKINFIKGIIINSRETNDFYYQGSTWNEQLYTVLGEDGKKYEGTYGNAYVGEFFIKTIDDYIKNVGISMEKNNKLISNLHKKNEILYQTIISLILSKEQQIEITPKEKRLIRKNKKMDN